MDDFAAFKEEVKSRVDIVDVVGEFVELKKRGINFVAPCPFHQETKPSFNVNRERQFFHCFGCGKGGDVLTFLTEITGMSFMEALEQLAGRAGLEMPHQRTIDSTRKEVSERIASANMAAAEYFHRTLSEPAGNSVKVPSGRGRPQRRRDANVKALRAGQETEHVIFGNV